MPRGIPNAKPATAAKNNPVNRPARETHTADTAVTELEPVNLALDQDLVRERIVIPPAGPLDKVYADALAFAEEPVTIMIAKGVEKYAADHVSCWCNGDPAEVFIRGTWVKMGWLPVNRQITTKRKYVEILLRSKQTSYTTQHASESQDSNAHIDNHVVPNTSRKVQLSVIGDTSAKGAEWLQNLLTEQE